ncbi:MAG: HlyD family secretion protein [Planctomycetota bacterium]
MHEKRKFIFTGIVIAIAVIAILVRYQVSVTNPWTRDGQVRATIVQIASRVTAPLVELPVKDNQAVRKGDLLFRIDPSDFELAVENARVQLDQAREDVIALEAAVRASEAQLNEARASLTSAQSQVGAAQADLESAKAKVTEAGAGVAAAKATITQNEATVEEVEREAARARRLADQKAGSIEEAQAKEAKLAASRAQLESAHAGLSEANARLVGARAGVSQAEANLVITRNGVNQAQAQVDTAVANRDQAKANLGESGEANVRVREAKVALKQAELQLSWTSIHAPVDGLITNLSLQVGDQAIANQPMIALVDLNSFWIDAYFKENQIGGMKIGDEAVITLMSYPDRPIVGRIDGIGWGIAQQDGSTGEELLPNISPTFEWIRLAQRVPVQIGQLELPQGVELRVGTTASVQVNKGTHSK